MIRIPFLLAFLLCTSLSAKIPPAEDLLRGAVSGGDVDDASSSELSLAGLLEEDPSTGDYVADWTVFLKQWLMDPNLFVDGKGLAATFPDPEAWGFLAESLGAVEAAPVAPILFQIAVAQGEYGVAEQLMKGAAVSEQGGSLLRAMIGRGGSDRSRKMSQFWFLRTAAFSSIDASFSKEALEQLLVFLSRSPDQYFRTWGLRVPDLEKAFGKERAVELLSGIFLTNEPQLDPSQLSVSDRAAVLTLLIENGVVGTERFEDFLDPSQPGFERAKAYLEGIDPQFPSSELRVNWISSYLYMDELEEAGEQLALLQAQSEEDFEVAVFRLVDRSGYRYSTRSLSGIVTPLLEEASPEFRDEILLALQPLDPENDPVIADLDERMEEEESPSNELLWLKIERLFALGRTEDAVAELENFINEGLSFRLASDSGPSEALWRQIRVARALEIIGGKEAILGVILESISEYARMHPRDEKMDMLGTFVELLYDFGLYDEAIDEAAEGLRLELAQRGDGGYYWMEDPFLVQLVVLYVEAGLPEEALFLINRSPFWKAEGVSELSDEGLGETAFPVAVARALAETGSPDRAVALLQDFLARHDDADDDAYAQLIALEGGDAIPFLDWLIEQNPFEERPLIWKAGLLLQEGLLAEAEETARKAIAIDPTDGEMGARDRLRAYKVLGKVLGAAGQTEESALMERIVVAVDLAEEADELRLAGMTLPALALYQESLEIFTDAYCIQFRTAVELKEAGRIDEAQAHLRKAYELMPHQFGRIESHCFGCEGAFRGEWERNIALDVFNGMIEEDPENPTLYYLLGYLEESRDRDDEALVHFERAVDLDPLYVNSWRKILRILQYRPLTENVDLRKRSFAAMIELSPRANGFSLDRMPLEWFPLFWDAIQAKLEPSEWISPVVYKLGANPLALDWTDQSSSYGTTDEEMPRTAGSIFSESTDLFQAVGVAAR